MSKMQENQQRRSRNQQKPKLSQLEFSKRLAMIDVIMWGICSVGLIAVLILVPSVAIYCQNMLTTFATVYVSLRLGYTAKAGVENYQKISSMIAAGNQEVSEDNSNG